MLKKALRKIKYVVCDISGTVSYGGEPIGDMAYTLKRLRESGKMLLFITNNSSCGRAYLKDTFDEMGLSDDRDLFYSSGSATIDYVKENYPGKRVYLIGTSALEASFKEAGVLVVDDNPEVAVLGLDTTMSYEKLAKLITAVRNGAVFVQTHPDLYNYYSGNALPDCGSFAKIVEACTGIKPSATVGMPSKFMGEKIMSVLNCNADEILMVGDKLETDIKFGIDCRFYTLAVLSGQTTEKMLKASDIDPDFVLPSLNDIVDYLDD